ncbi:MAG: HEAT repeat domain-containing protein, partial [Planctomycetota bacterium]|nr:HEAT repeat domain-containing protein [Planctomycetota bacterium]
NHRQAVRSLLLAAFILLPSSSILAQSSGVDSEFSDGLRAFRAEAYETALEHFRRVVSMDPSQADAVRLMNESQDALVQLMMADNPEFRTFALTVLEAARTKGVEAIRDADAAAEVAARCFEGTYTERGKAIWELGMTYGPFAVPPLVSSLNSDDSTRFAAIYALSRLGSDALPPLLVASHSENNKVRLAVAQVLVEMGDPRAIPRLAQMAKSDSDGSIRALCRGYATNVESAYLKQGLGYYNYDPSLGLSETENHGVRWGLDGQAKLFFDELEAGLIPMELAKGCFEAAAQSSDSNLASQAARGLALVYAAEVALLRAVGENVRAAEQFNAGLSLSTEALNSALGEALRSSNDVPTAAVLIEMLDSPAAIQAGNLRTALNSSVPTISFSAAISLANAGEQGSTLVSTLMRAASIQGLHSVQIFSADNAFANNLAEGLASSANCTSLIASDAASGLSNLYRGLNIDAFVIQDPLPDTYARQLVKRIRQNGKYANTPILVQGNGSATGDIDDATVYDTLTFQDVRSSLSELDPERMGYRRTAARAAEALAGMANRSSGSGAGVQQSLVSFLGREDDVAIPIMMALGHWGTAAEAQQLLSEIADGGNSAQKRAAAARALDGIMTRDGTTKLLTEDENVLRSAMTVEDVELAQACATVLGRGKAIHKSVQVSAK